MLSGIKPIIEQVFEDTHVNIRLGNMHTGSDHGLESQVTYYYISVLLVLWLLMAYIAMYMSGFSNVKMGITNYLQRYW